jgi:transposase-like protein
VANTSKRFEPTNLVQAIQYFADDERAFAFVMRMRWDDGPVVCPRCGHNETTFVQTRRIWKCKGCKKQFSIKVGTIFEDSPIGFDRWLPAVWLITNSKNSVSSHELGRALGVTQKTAWFMLHRIRLAFETPAYKRMTGTVEVDETYVGGKAKNMHKWQRRIKIRGRGMVYKTPVQGARERETGQVRAEVIRGDNAGKSYASNVTEWVTLGSTVYTDQFSGYRRLGEKFQHDYVTHTRDEFVRGEIHVNGMENFWALLKRALKGTQTHCNPEHLHRYVQERVFSYNHCMADDIGRMKVAMRRTAGRRITYVELISGK